MLEMVQLPDQGDRYPSQLSGGQQQRVGLARALVIKPAVLLLDEPFGALDKKLRDSMQLELRQLQQALKVTSIFVTHDQEEALTISDRIAVVSDGRIEQIDTPQALYEAPATQFVLHFVGASNNLLGRITSADGSGIVAETPQGVKIRSTAKPTADLTVGKEVIIACRPEKAWLMPANEVHAGNSVPGMVREEVYLGSVTHYFIDGPDHHEMRVYQLNAPGGRADRVFHVGEQVNLAWDDDNTLVFPR
jgi:ABC-type Fe3+/spermidine/putrescine transport system ATPase subunit